VPGGNHTSDYDRWDMSQPLSHLDVHRVVIVGSGDCGARVALNLRERGFDGDITLIGEEPDAPYERPELSKSVLTFEATPPKAIASELQLAELGITWLSNVRAVAVDAKHHTVALGNGVSVGYDRLLLATGARARRPPMPGADIARSLRSLSDAVALRADLGDGTRLLVIGGGFIGLEAAATAVERGCKVTVVEFAQRLMSRVVPNMIAEHLHARHTAAGCDLRLGVGVDRIDHVDGDYVALLSDGTQVVFDLAIAGIGAIPNTELAATARLAITNGIAVDEQLRTSDGAIYAAGDCCSIPHPIYDGARLRVEAWQSAVTQAEVVAENLLGGSRTFDAIPWFWSDQYDLHLQIAGLHSFASREVVRRRADGAELLFGLDAGGRVVAASGIAHGLSISRDISVASSLIAARTVVQPSDLSDASLDLRSLARSRRGEPGPT
jgi:3-phenylpropionate/trans-cinnamate dioxygenase ferredoxin reductase component